MLKNKIKLNNGLEIPIIGLGTWQTPNDITSRVVQEAIDVGYIHIDTANAYDNEQGVGEGIRKSGINRENIFVASKIPAEIKSYQETKKKIDESLTLLNIDYIDLMLIHCPCPWNEFKKHSNAIANNNWDGYQRHGYQEENLQVWCALEEAVQQGKIKSIGISNFFNKDTENILNHCSIKPVINQINYHIGFEQNDIVEFCHNNNILIEAYSPIATGDLLNNESVKEIANKYGVSVAQLSIRYSLDKTDIVLPKTTHKEFMIQNAKLDFNISEEDIKTLSFIDNVQKYHH